MVFLGKPELATDPYKEPNGWWLVVALLPAAFFFQMVSLPLAQEAYGMSLGYAWIDGLVALRCVYGLIWQCGSHDWRIYCGILCASYPFVGIVSAFTR